ncbi:Uncharacterized protein SAPIO_CDS1452 [Scedosporium apiospermum]|uniref:Rhodopsin domain-containing protein n=1 Tax=Pseudallescheria apiosperma TaxID=563466 RepID=A0A084GEB9_PSEDA|nr:Uncharacterized protein SAPIO_CDS1452 [Scedosporium apiospermum]KEZ45681.1 Uncharacterized protein SAPIO_CDS1452 [Scedosporium apiospermum]
MYDRGPQLQAVFIFLLVLCVVTVALRCYTMAFIVKRLGVEDWLAIVALILYVVYTSFALLSVKYGTGRHLAAVPPEDRPVAFMWRHFATIVYIVISTLTKFIVGLLLLRICSHIRWMKIFIWVMLVVVGVYNAFYFFLDIFSAQPVEYYWLRFAPNPPPGHVNDTKFAIIPTFIASILNIIVDWALAILPMILLWKAKMDRRTKISVIIVLTIGSIASVATIVRLPYASQLLQNDEYLYNFTDFAIWSTVEIGLALSASSLATLRPLFRKLKILSSTQGHGISHQNGDGKPHSYGRLGRQSAQLAPHADLESPQAIHDATPHAIYGHRIQGSGRRKWEDPESASESEICMVNLRTN